MLTILTTNFIKKKLPLMQHDKNIVKLRSPFRKDKFYVFIFIFCKLVVPDDDLLLGRNRLP